MIWGYLGMKREDWAETYLVPSSYSREEKKKEILQKISRVGDWSV